MPSFSQLSRLLANPKSRGEHPYGSKNDDTKNGTFQVNHRKVFYHARSFKNNSWVISYKKPLLALKLHVWQYINHK